MCLTFVPIITSFLGNKKRKPLRFRFNKGTIFLTYSITYLVKAMKS